MATPEDITLVAAIAATVEGASTAAPAAKEDDEEKRTPPFIRMAPAPYTMTSVKESWTFMHILMCLNCDYRWPYFPLLRHRP